MTGPSSHLCNRRHHPASIFYRSSRRGQLQRDLAAGSSDLLLNLALCRAFQSSDKCFGMNNSKPRILWEGRHDANGTVGSVLLAIESHSAEGTTSQSLSHQCGVSIKTITPLALFDARLSRQSWPASPVDPWPPFQRSAPGNVNPPQVSGLTGGLS